MDLKSLLQESGSLGSALGPQNDIDSLKKAVGASMAEELTRVQPMLTGASGRLSQGYTSIAEQEAVKTLGLNAVGMSGLTAGGLGTVESFASGFADKSMGLGALDLPKGPRDYGATDWKELDRKAHERELHRSMMPSMEFSQRMFREAAEARKREDAKVEYARRSAEASEQVLAEERSKRASAEIAATQAQAEKVTAEERAERAERSSRRMERLAVIGLLGTVVSLLLAAWPFLREYLGL